MPQNPSISILKHSLIYLLTMPPKSKTTGPENVSNGSKAHYDWSLNNHAKIWELIGLLSRPDIYKVLFGKKDPKEVSGLIKMIYRSFDLTIYWRNLYFFRTHQAKAKLRFSSYLPRNSGLRSMKLQTKVGNPL
jgi:hypothetical protein